MGTFSPSSANSEKHQAIIFDIIIYPWECNTFNCMDIYHHCGGGVGGSGGDGDAGTGSNRDGTYDGMVSV